ncbi:hypothetical protein CPB86DRAFT_387939 [Serendipita vermifera]|nr:hypothetical protein CPB86DRAFT_387939 [Serendipita vermifera]
MATIDPAVFDSPYYKFDPKHKFLRIIKTDSDGNQHIPLQTVEKNGKVYWTELPGEDVCDKSVDLWKRKVGTELVTKFLQVNPGDKSKRDFWLEDFPPGYKFYTRRVKTREGRFEREDSYLLANKGLVFRSPNEFLRHAAWLMRGAQPGHCLCKYCHPASQTKINDQLKRNQQKIRMRMEAARIEGAHIKRRPNAVNTGGFVKHSDEEEEDELYSDE